MTKSIEEILNNMPLDDAAKTDVREAWESALADAKVAQNDQLRQEMSTRYESDLEKIHEAFSQYLEERIKPHVEDLQENVAAVDNMKLEYARKTAEVKEAAQAHVSKKLGALRKVMETTIRREISEVHEDVVAARKASLIAISEKKNELEKERQLFRTKATRVLESIINVKIPKQLDALKEDIVAARKDDFGRQIFEAFSASFQHQFFNSSEKFKELAEAVADAKAEASRVKAKAAKAIKESREEAAASEAARVKVVESVQRAQTMARLLKPLKGTARQQMKTLLEATKTKNLDATFRKSYPQIVKEANKPAPRSRRLAETSSSGRRKTQSVEFLDGGTKLNEEAYDQFDDQISEIRRLAGNS